MLYEEDMIADAEDCGVGLVHFNLFVPLYGNFPVGDLDLEDDNSPYALAWAFADCHLIFEGFDVEESWYRPADGSDCELVGFTVSLYTRDDNSAAFVIWADFIALLDECEACYIDLSREIF